MQLSGNASGSASSNGSVSDAPRALGTHRRSVSAELLPIVLDAEQAEIPAKISSTTLPASPGGGGLGGSGGGGGGSNYANAQVVIANTVSYGTIATNTTANAVNGNVFLSW